MLRITSAIDKYNIQIEDIDWIGLSSNPDGDIFIITKKNMITVDKRAIDENTFKYISCEDDKCYETTDNAWKLFEKLCDILDDR